MDGKLSERLQQLLAAAGDAYLDGRDPFSPEFLREHGVTLEECQALQTAIGRLVTGYIYAPRETRAEVDACYCCAAGGMEPSAMLQMMRLGQAGRAPELRR